MSWIGALLIIVGYLFVIYKQRIGFFMQTAGCVLMISLYLGKDGGIVLVNSIFIAVNVLGYLKWRNNV